LSTDDQAGLPGGTAAPGGLSQKARRTRESLIAAARQVFARDGFIEARIGDISAAASVAHGTFYTYFDSKEAIFREVVMGLVDEMMRAQLPAGPTADPLARIEAANRIYIRTYLDNAALLAVLEQVVTFNEEIRQIRKDMRRPFFDRNVRAIRRWQAAGMADPELDPAYAASALSAMVDRFMYVWQVLGEDFDEDRAVATLSRMWAGALGLPIAGRAGPSG
jgi:AcrR family transcriptional regulator